MTSELREPSDERILEDCGDGLHSEIAEYDIWRQAKNDTSTQEDIVNLATEAGVFPEDSSFNDDWATLLEASKIPGPIALLFVGRPLEQERKAREFVVRLNDALENTNNWDERVGGHGDVTYTFYASNLYYDFEDSGLEKIFDDEIDEAFSNAKSEAGDYIDKKELAKAMRGEEFCKWSADKKKRDWTWDSGDSIETGRHASASFDWTKVSNQVLREYGFEIEEEEEPGEAPLPPENVIYTFPDGYYVADLSSAEFKKEGDLQGFCLGQPAHGYIRRKDNEEIRVLSLRRPRAEGEERGKPLLTFEIGISNRDGTGGYPRGERVPAIVHQIHGKGNRKPGWDLGDVGGAFKEDESKKAAYIVKNLMKLDPKRSWHLYPAMMALEGKLDKVPVEEWNEGFFRQEDYRQKFPTKNPDFYPGSVGRMF